MPVFVEYGKFHPIGGVSNMVREDEGVSGREEGGVEGRVAL